MTAPRPTTPKCFFAALVFAWATFIYLPSALIALAVSPAVGTGFAAATLAIADEVAPAAKIGFALALAALAFLVRERGRARLLADLIIALVAMLLPLALLPAAWSRGFGIGLTDTRFALGPLAAYAIGALVAGLVFHWSEAKCLRRGSARR